MDTKLVALTLRVAELEARQARMEKTLARQRRINEALLAIMEHGGWTEMQAAVDKALAIEWHTQLFPLIIGIDRWSSLFGVSADLSSAGSSMGLLWLSGWEDAPIRSMDENENEISASENVCP